MSSWHRQNPDLAGTSADPWMAHRSHREATYDVTRLQGCHATYEQVVARDEDVCRCGMPAESHRSEPA